LKLLANLASNHDFVKIINAFIFRFSHIKIQFLISIFFSISSFLSHSSEKSLCLCLAIVSASLIIEVIISTVFIGYFHIAVSQDNIRLSVHCKTELNVSVLSALVGKGLSIIVSRRCVAVIVNFHNSLHFLIILY
jgi:hypothetical protein